MEYRILGPLAVLAGHDEITPGRPKQRALLATMLLSAGEIVPGERLIDVLWGDRPPATALNALHGHVAALRRLLGPGAIETRARGYRLQVRPGAVDLGRFDALAAEARAEPDPARRSDLLRTALALFHGPPLADVREFDALRADTARIEELRLLALEARIDADLALGRHADVVPELERLAGDHPLRERVRAQLMLALYRSGRQADALAANRDAVRVLAHEVGLEPGPALRSLERAILANDPSIAAPEPRAPSAPHRRERKLVSVLACHLLEPYRQELDPEDAEALLERRLEVARKELEHFGGTIESVAGDAMLSAFGARGAHEDDAERAVRAALEVRARLGVRVSVVTAEALVTDGQGVAGDAASRAWRLCDGAPSAAVVVSDRTRRASNHAIAYEGGGAGASRATGPRQRPERRRPSATLAGRGRELDLLTGSLARARATREPLLVTLIGAPGIGKTRLVRELYAIAASDPAEIVWLQGRCLPYGHGITFWALGEIVKAHAGVFESDAPPVVSRKLEIAVAEALGAMDGRVLDHLRRLVGLGGGGPLAAERRDGAFAAWREFFHGVAERAPLVLAVEDLQWADDALLDFLDDLAGTPADVPMLVLLTSRPDLLDTRRDWGAGKRNAATLSLGPLSEGETRGVLAELLGRAPDDVLVRRAQGVPLYAEEYARLVLAGGRAEELPESLHGLIAARLDTLPPEEKALLQDAAVVGEVAWLGAIAAAGGRSAAALDELARSLERKDLLRRRRRSAVEGETELSFHHVLVRDVAYGQIPRAARGEKHRLTARWIESLGRREDHVELLAHHYVRALELTRAAGGEVDELERLARTALSDAGDRAARLGNLPGAAQLYGRALELWPAGDGRGMLLLRLSRVLRVTEVSGETELRAAADELLAAGDREHAAEALSLLLSLHQEQGRTGLAERALHDVFALVDDLPRSRGKAEVLSELCRSLMMSHDDERAIRIGQEALAICEPLGLSEVQASVLISVGAARSVADPRTGDAEIERGIAIALAAGSHEAARGYGNLASGLMDRAQLQASYAARRAGQEYADRFGLRWYSRWLRIEALAELFHTTAEWDELLERAEPLVREPTFMAQLALGYAIRVRVARGETHTAADAAQRLAAIARAAAEPQASAAALSVAALGMLHAGGEAECDALAGEALAMVGRSGPRTLYLAAPVLGDLLYALGRGGEFAAAVAPASGAASPWVDAALASAAGEFARAAATYERVGARPDEARARVRRGAQLVRGGRATEAERELSRAEAFFAPVRAAAALEEIGALRARPR